MKLPIRTILVIVVALALTSLAGCEAPKVKWRSEARAEEAERDIAAGKLCLKTYGLPEHRSRKYYAMAKEKYDLDFDRVAGCFVDEQLVERVKGYNEPMLQEISRRFGPNALENLAKEARVQSQQEDQADHAITP